MATASASLSDAEVLAQLDWTRARSEIRMDLSVVSVFAEDAENLQCPVVHVAGTNGKGSAVWSIARGAPSPCGCFTSPFIEHITECIAVDGEAIPTSTCVELTLAVQAAETARGVKLTAFERLTVVALRYFRLRGVALAVVECGMGGRLDSTNIVRPAVCVITSVGLDHMAVLGNTVEAIAREKGGIFKAGANVVLGPETPALLDDMAAAVGAKEVVRLPTIAGELYTALSQRIAETVVGMLGLAGASEVVAATPSKHEVNGHHRPKQESLLRASVSPPCRFEVATDASGREFVLDAAHNVPGIEAMCKAARARYPPEKRIAVLAVIAKDKQVAEMLSVLRGLTPDVTKCAGTTPRACPYGPGLAVAMAAAVRRADVIIVCGTFEIMSTARKLVSSYTVSGACSPRLLVVDHDDSFTHNIIHMLLEVGAVPECIRAFDSEHVSEWECSQYSGLVLSPGPGGPANASDVGISSGLLQKECSIPVLGVCLGHQLLAHLHGGVVGQCKFPRHGRVSTTTLNEAGMDDELFQGMPAQFPVVRYHSLAVLQLPDCLVPLASAAEPDGSTSLMAMRHTSLPQWGVQFHPESIGSAFGKQLFANFLDIVRRLAAAGAPHRSIPAPVLPSASLQCLQGSRLLCLSAKENSSAAAAASMPPGKLQFTFRELPCNGQAPIKASVSELAFDIFQGLCEPRVILESAQLIPGFSRYSFAAGAPYLGDLSFTLSYRMATGLVTCDGPGAPFSSQAVADVPAFLALLATILDWRSAQSNAPFDLSGGLVGFLGYELGEGLLPSNGGGDPCVGDQDAQSKAPDAWFLFVDRFIAVDGLLQRAFACSLEPIDAVTRWAESAEAEALVAKSMPPSSSLLPPQAPSHDEAKANTTSGRCAKLSCSHSRQECLDTVRKCQELIKEGQSYELCFTVRYTSPDVVGDAIQVYSHLRRCNPAPYSFMYEFGELAVLSSSPERFMTVDRSGVVTCKPMKGTARRDLKDPAKDLAAKEALAASEKDQAENLMIVDLVRHDLSRVCEPGSVRCPHLMVVESFTSVHQMVSQVRGQLPRVRGQASGVSSHTLLEVVASCFPPGSMTGAPKPRSVELLRGLEKNLKRGVYSGVAGFLSTSGAADLCVVIRTIQLAKEGGVYMGTGSAITMMSEPEAEFDEVQSKVERLLQAVANCTPVQLDDDQGQALSCLSPSSAATGSATSSSNAIRVEPVLLETMLWNRGAASCPYLWELHCKRLERSAVELDIHLPSRQELLAALEQSCRDHPVSGPLRVRLLVERRSLAGTVASDIPPAAHVTVTATQLGEVPADFPWSLAATPRRVCLDVQPAVHSNDKLLLHKTLWRSCYDEARQRMLGSDADLFDVILFNERYEVTETSIANIAIETPTGEWATPALHCGLLPGVQREAFLQEGVLREDVIGVNDLIDAALQGRRLLCFNSVRGAYLVSLVHAHALSKALPALS